MKKTRLPYILILVGIGVGLLLTVQWKTPPQRSVNPLGPYLALRQTYDDLTKEQAFLKSEIAELQKSIDAEATSSKQDIEALSLAEQGKELKDKVGLTEKTGPGVNVTLDDSPSGHGTEENISHAADLRDTVNVLWRSGAQAISINGERIVASTSIDCIVNTILINNTKTTAPFTISAIGDSHRLEKAINDSAELTDLWKRAKSQGLVFKVKTDWKITVSAFSGSFPLDFIQRKDN